MSNCFPCSRGLELRFRFENETKQYVNNIVINDQLLTVRNNSKIKNILFCSQKHLNLYLGISNSEGYLFYYLRSHGKLW